MNVGSRKNQASGIISYFYQKQDQGVLIRFCFAPKKISWLLLRSFSVEDEKKKFESRIFLSLFGFVQKMNDKQNLRKAISVFHLSSKKNWKDYLFVVVAAAFACCSYCCWCRWRCCCCTFWAQLLLWLVAIAFVASVEAFVDAATTLFKFIVVPMTGYYCLLCYLVVVAIVRCWCST